MRRLYTLFFTPLLAILLASCSTKEQFNTSPLANYKALWEILDKGYCYFDEKLPPDSSWLMMYEKHLPKVREDMSSSELFDLLALLTYELKDGHVTLYSSFDTKSYHNWVTDYPSNLNPAIRSRYLGENYRIAGSLYYAPITYLNHQADSIGLIYYRSFSSGVSHANMNAVLYMLRDCKGLIIDIRGNGGGSVDRVHTIASHFAQEKTLVGYMSYKAGPRPNDFSEPEPMYLKPFEKGIRWLRPVVVLTNRSVYSAANDFSLFMKQLPQVVLLGDTTGGGGGLPRGAELPNGWRVRYSGSKTTDPNGNHVEHGIEPNIAVSLQEEDLKEGKDTLIEAAINYINEQTKRS